MRSSYFNEVETIIDYWQGQGRSNIAVFMQNDAFGKAVLDGVELALSRHNLDPVAVDRFERGEMPSETSVRRAMIPSPCPDSPWHGVQ